MEHSGETYRKVVKGDLRQGSIAAGPIASLQGMSIADIGVSKKSSSSLLYSPRQPMATNQPHTKRDVGGQKSDKTDKSKGSPAQPQKKPGQPTGKPPTL